MTHALALHVDATRCIRCGACAALCPTVFDVGGTAARVVRPPTGAEQPLAEAARWICPTEAVRLSGASAVTGDAEPASPDPSRSLFDELATGAERVRWTLEGLPWAELDASRAAPSLRLLVREMAYSENATYSATQRFLEAFVDDVDLSRWIAVWFYEETRHPYVLLEWLRRAGEEIAPDFVAKGRVSTPFMRSNAGTLVTNVISEVVAAQAYRWLGQQSPEPTLARIALLIAGDEARHAASFFRFARRALEGGTPRDRARALEVLEAWLAGARSPTHPVAQMKERLGDAHAEAVDGLTTGATRARIVRLVGLLLDLPLRQPEDVAPLLRGLLARAAG